VYSAIFVVNFSKNLEDMSKLFININSRNRKGSSFGQIC